MHFKFRRHHAKGRFHWQFDISRRETKALHAPPQNCWKWHTTTNGKLTLKRLIGQQFPRMRKNSEKNEVTTAENVSKFERCRTEIMRVWRSFCFRWLELFAQTYSTPWVVFKAIFTDPILIIKLTKPHQCLSQQTIGERLICIMRLHWNLSLSQY